MPTRAVSGSKDQCQKIGLKELLRRVFATESEPVTEENAHCQHQQRDWPKRVEVSDKVQEAPIRYKRSKVPFDEKSEEETGHCANNREGNRSAAGAEPGGKTHRNWWQHERVKALSGNPKEHEVTDNSTNGCTD